MKPVSRTEDGLPNPSGTIYVRLFGPMEIRIDGQPVSGWRSRKTRWLLALLALRAGKEVERSWLAGTLWPDKLEHNAFANLRWTLYDFRRSLRKMSWIIQTPSTRCLRLDVPAMVVDAMEFDLAIDRGDCESLERAVAVYRGPLLEGCLEEWAIHERAKREIAYLNALEVLAVESSPDQAERAIGRLRTVVSIDPCRETAWRSLMLILGSTGNYGAAVQAYRELRLYLRSTLNTEPAAETSDLFHRLRQEAARNDSHRDIRSKTADSGQIRAKRGIPSPISSLVGQHSAIADLVSMVRRARLVTVAGTGGIGKTRLATEAALRLMPEFGGGACFVDLASYSDPTRVPEAVSAVLELTDDPRVSVTDQLSAALAGSDLLILLDNCEHLLEGCAHFTHTLLANCPGLRILATSREPLGLTGETIFRVSPLSYPSHCDGTESGKRSEQFEDGQDAQLNDFESVRLFLERACQREPGFITDSAALGYIGRISSSLEGNPLAIEMAAARAPTSDAAQISATLSDRISALTSGDRIAPSRHQSLKAVIDWSYMLLTEEEKTLLMRLSVFSGGWTLHSAECICGSMEFQNSGTNEFAFGCSGPSADAPTKAVSKVAESLNCLVNKSLVVCEQSLGKRRFRLLETVREYAGGLLRESGEWTLLHSRHLQYFLKMCQCAEPQLFSHDQLLWLQRLEQENANLQSVLEWSVLEANDVAHGLELAAALGHYWWLRSHYHEGSRWMSLALSQRLSLSPRVRPTALHYAGAFELIRGNVGEMKRLAGEAYRLFCKTGDLRRAAFALILANTGESNRDIKKARRLYAQALNMARSSGDPWIECFALAHCALVEADLKHASELHERALSLARSVGDRWTISTVLLNLGALCTRTGDLAAAEAVLGEALELVRQLGERRWICTSLNALAEIAISKGDWDTATQRLNECRNVSRQSGLSFEQELCMRLAERLEEVRRGT